MRRLGLPILSFLLLVAAGQAQDVPGVAPPTPLSEWTADYSYMRIGNNDNDPHIPKGWHSSFSANLNHWLGAVADFSGHYGHQEFVTALGAAEAGTDVHTFLFGPRFSYRWDERMTPFGHALFGLARIHRDGTAFFGETTEHPFAMAIGGGIDFNLTDRFAVRGLQADYVLTRPGDSNVNNLRLAAGITYKFGSR